MKYKSVNAIICKTTSKTFQAYWRELRRHENALRNIYAKDNLHRHVPEEVGSVHRVHPGKERYIVSFFRCAICMKDLTEIEARKLRSHS